MTHIASAIAVMKTLTLLLGGLITYFSFKAYRRSGSPALRALALGFGTITAGSILAGGINLFAGVDLQLAVLLQSVTTALGFAIITYSLYVKE